MMMIKVAVTATEYHKAQKEFMSARKTGLDCLCAPGDEKELHNIRLREEKQYKKMNLLNPEILRKIC